MFWLDLYDELLCQEVILAQSMYRSSTRERGYAWKRIADSLNFIENRKFYVSQRSV